MSTQQFANYDSLLAYDVIFFAIFVIQSRVRDICNVNNVLMILLSGNELNSRIKSLHSLASNQSVVRHFGIPMKGACTTIHFRFVYKSYTHA